MLTPQEKYLKLKKIYPEDPDVIRANSESKKIADKEMQEMFLEVRDRHLKLEKARIAALQARKEKQFKPKMNPQVIRKEENNGE